MCRFHNQLHQNQRHSTARFCRTHQHAMATHLQKLVNQSQPQHHYQAHQSQSQSQSQQQQQRQHQHQKQPLSRAHTHHRAHCIHHPAHPNHHQLGHTQHDVARSHQQAGPKQTAPFIVTTGRDNQPRGLSIDENDEENRRRKRRRPTDSWRDDLIVHEQEQHEQQSTAIGKRTTMRFISQLYFLIHLSAILSLLLHHKNLVTNEGWRFQAEHRYSGKLTQPALASSLLLCHCCQQNQL